MANNCYNRFSFYGNDKIQKKVQEWKHALKIATTTTKDPLSSEAVKIVFYPEVLDKDSIEMGANWVHQDEVSTDAEDDQIGFLSAWSPPGTLHQRMAILLYHLDPHVVIKNTFDIENGAYGIAYATPYDSQKAYFEEVEVEVDYEAIDEELDDPQSAEDDANDQLRELELELLIDLMQDMPGTAKVIKKYIPNLDVDWDEFENN